MDEEELDRLILAGAIRPAGLDGETGEMLYEFTEKLLKVAPEIFHAVVDSHVTEIYHLWERGFVDMTITDDNPLVKITEKALDDEAVASLTPYMQSVIKEIVRISRIDNEE